MSYRHVSGGYLTRTTNLPSVPSTWAGFFTRKVDRNNYSMPFITWDGNTNHYCGVYTDANNETFNIATEAAWTALSGLEFANDVTLFLCIRVSATGAGGGTLSARRIDTGTSLTSQTFSVGASFTAPNIYRFGDDSYGSWFDGESEGAFAWNRVLSDAEVLRQSYQRTPITRRGLVLWYPMIGDASDYSGNGYNLTVTGSPTVAAGTRKGSWRGGNARC